MHQKWMQLALSEARKAGERGEVPIGAVVVYEDRVIARGHNLIETLQEPTAHAEIIAVNAAANALLSWRLEEVTLYVTLEPCPMCLGAIHLARIPRLVYGAGDPRLGACGSRIDLTGLDAMGPPVEIIAGVEAEESAQLLKSFFQKLRREKKRG